jgi:hypothetical protein
MVEDPEEVARMRKIDKATSLVYEGHARRAVQSLARTGAADMDETRLAKLKGLHPKRGNSPLPNPPAHAPRVMQVDKEKLVEIIRMRLANGASPGRSGWTGDLLKALIDEPECIEGLATITLLIINGDISGKLKQVLLTSVLVGIDKPNGGIRPVAVGEVFYKMAALYIMAVVEEEMKEALGPQQFAMLPGGAESALVTIQTALEINPGWALISCDLVNAFNARSRDEILQAVYRERKLQDLWRITAWAYGEPSPLHVMKDGRLWATLKSSQGVKQGDALSAFLFALSMAKIYERTTANTFCTFVAVQDDFYILGPPTEAMKAWDNFVGQCTADSGISVNKKKTMALVPEQKWVPAFEQLGIEVKTELIPALGGVVTRDDGIASNWLRRESESKHESMFRLLVDKHMPSQIAFILLRMCMIPLANYWARTNRPSRTKMMAREFDTRVADTMATIINAPNLPFAARKLIQMPVGMGGFGLRSVELTARAAWLSAMGQAMRACKPLLPAGEHPGAKWTSEVADVLSDFNALRGMVKLPTGGHEFWDEFGNEPPKPGLQRAIMNVVLRHEQDRMLDDARGSPKDTARLVGLSCRESGLWLTTLPTHPMLRMRDISFQLAAKARLGLQMTEGIRVCKCGKPVEGDPLHFLSCRKLLAVMTLRHNKVLGTLASIAKLIPMPHQIETKVDSEGKSRTDGLFMFHSNSVMIDVAITCPTGDTYMKAARTALGAATIREKQKIRKYESEVHKEGIEFVPFVVETTGGFGGRAKKGVKAMIEETMASSNPWRRGPLVNLFGDPSQLRFKLVMQW